MKSKSTFQTSQILTNLTKSLKKSWKTGNLFYRTILNQQNKELIEIQLERKKHKAFLYFDKISLIISKTGLNNHFYEQQFETCENCIIAFQNSFPEFPLLKDKLQESLNYRKKSVIKQSI